MLTRPRVLLHLEGAAVLAVALFCYQQVHASWLLFGLLFLVPDLSMIGFAAGPRAGAAAYNLAHTEVLPVLLGIAAAWAHHSRALSIALIWVSHIGFDRLLGYGLKYPTHFKDTHLQRL
ncbi:DUF4260 domain-containing protein [Terriglobus albidus]|uniref:DUF4260 domain-containing protein n=1 Tax=Terriglobus albidus TaxID=1592106 RepID=UPI0021DFEDA0|nr:DUF4260 domain-containing protein [Terriglobus albidus]